MSNKGLTIGIVGGSGMLGRALAQAVLQSAFVPPGQFWISNRSGHSDLSELFPGVTVTNKNQELADACDIIVLSVPPTNVEQINLSARDKLAISVMAGVTLHRLHHLTGSNRVIRAMSSPAAKDGLAYSPWCVSADVTETDRKQTTAFFEVCGLSDQVETEAQIDGFTAMTGPVPGFVALFAKAMVDYGIAQGIPESVADRAVRQLFLAAGKMMSEGPMTPADHVEEMIDYAGSTAAGLEAMVNLSVPDRIADGLDASVAWIRAIS